MRADGAAGQPSLTLTEGASGQLSVRGALVFATARAARETGLRTFGATAARAIQIDCSGVTASDSAGMAVLLDWLTFAKSSGRSLCYRNLPEQVEALARISEVLTLLEQGV